MKAGGEKHSETSVAELHLSGTSPGWNPGDVTLVVLYIMRLFFMSVYITELSFSLNESDGL